MVKSAQAKVRAVQAKSKMREKRNTKRMNNKRRGEHGCSRLHRLDAERNGISKTPETVQPESRGFVEKVRGWLWR